MADAKAEAGRRPAKLGETRWVRWSDSELEDTRERPHGVGRPTPIQAYQIAQPSGAVLVGVERPANGKGELPPLGTGVKAGGYYVEIGRAIEASALEINLHGPSESLARRAFLHSIRSGLP